MYDAKHLVTLYSKTVRQDMQRARPQNRSRSASYGVLSTNHCGRHDMTQNPTRQRARPQWKQKPYALYIASLVFPTLVAYVFGNPDMIPSSIESVTSAITKSAIVI